MSEKTEISWTDATFNPVWGCTKVSPACDHCYAERDAKRFAAGKVLWGVGSERRTFGDAHWMAPVKWNKKAQQEGKRLRVFCASMADVFDKDWPDGVRERLWDLIDATPFIDWQLLTKRIGNVERMIPDRWSVSLPINVWLGATVVNQEEVDRDLPKLLRVNAHTLFVSIEPMLGPINLELEKIDRGVRRADLLHWVICGGESGAHARPLRGEWARSLRDQCAAANVAFHFKQWGEWSGPGLSFPDGHPEQTGTDDMAIFKVGKKAAGWLLDGVEHKAFPRGVA